MGRPAKPKLSAEDQEAIRGLLEDNARLEAERVAVLSQPRTVGSQIAHQWLRIKTLSNLSAVAGIRGDIGQVVSLTGAIDKCEGALRGLQKAKIDDDLEAIVARIQGQDEARDILAAAEDD